MDGGRQYGVDGEIWVEEKDGTEGQRSEVILRGGAIERYREGKREREEITASNKHMRDVFVPGDLQTSYFFMTTFV